MKIYLIAVCYNEKKLAPYFLKHYEPICDKIIIYDNMSTDGTVDILKTCEKVEIVPFDTGNNFDDKKHMDIKNNEWKKYKNECDWMICIDFDEFLYHPNLRQTLQKNMESGITVPSILGFQMVKDNFNFDAKYDQIYNDVIDGYYDHMFSKRIIFSPSKIMDMKYTIGAHNCKPTGIVIDGIKSNEFLYLFHFKHIGINYEKYKIEHDYTPRVEKNSGARGWYKMHLSNLKKSYRERFSKKKMILNLIGKINSGDIFNLHPELKNKSNRLISNRVFTNNNTFRGTNSGLNNSRIFKSRFKMNFSTNTGKINK